MKVNTDSAMKPNTDSAMKPNSFRPIPESRYLFVLVTRIGETNEWLDPLPLRGIIRAGSHLPDVILFESRELTRNDIP